MQEESGRMRLLDNEKDLEILNNPYYDPKIIREGMYFKIKRAYFKILKITHEGISAEGVSRREYFDNRNKRQ